MESRIFPVSAHSQTHSLQPCASKFIPGGTEIGGSPLALDLGTDMTGLPYQPWAAAAVKDRKADHGVDDPHVRCLPDNPPRPWVMPHLVKAVHSPKLLVLLYEVNAMYRQIFVDGRPSLDNPNPSWNGYSTARWEGDTLVVQTNGFRDDLGIDMGGSQMSEAAVMTERIRHPNYGTLELEITINDPKTYTRLWTVKMVQKNRTRYRVDRRDMSGKREVVPTTPGGPAEKVKPGVRATTLRRLRHKDWRKLYDDLFNDPRF
jgi:hypothetical protein